MCSVVWLDQLTSGYCICSIRWGVWCGLGCPMRMVLNVKSSMNLGLKPVPSVVHFRSWKTWSTFLSTRSRPCPRLCDRLVCWYVSYNQVKLYGLRRLVRENWTVHFYRPRKLFGALCDWLNLTWISLTTAWGGCRKTVTATVTKCIIPWETVTSKFKLASRTLRCHYMCSCCYC